ncbi:MAG: transcriptional regulator NrdR [Candidatus Nanoarchaeia archaeon]
MICPYCQHEETKVLETRETSDTETRRRRMCLKCEKRFTTYERVEQQPIFVVKKNGQRESFDKEKLSRGVIRSCEKRPVSMDEINKLIDKVEYKIRLSDTNEIKSARIGTLVMARLKKLDKIAYIRFASVYRDFADLEEFKNELFKLEQNKKRK